jgi:short-subunit dehydrogenase
MAERGLNVVLLARRRAVLDEVAAEIRRATGVDTRTVALDLAGPDATAEVVAATADLDVGMLMYNAGADPRYERFLANPVEPALGMVQRNCVVPLQLCHHFGPAMVARGRGGIVLVSSGAGLVGGPNMVAYGATKAFDIVLAEGLWAELHGSGVDVLSLVLGATDTRSGGCWSSGVRSPARTPPPHRGRGWPRPRRWSPRPSPTWPTARPGSPASSCARAPSG